MNFGFSEEQDLLRREVRKFLDERCPLPEVRRLAATPEGHSQEIWKALGELGFLGLVLPESRGGAGLGWVDLVVLLEETGRTLLPSPLVSTVVAGSLILERGSEEQKTRWLPSLADGSRVGTLVVLEESDFLAPEGIDLRARPDGDGWVLEGEKRFVHDAAQADLLLVAFRTGESPEEIAVAAVDGDAPGLSVENVATLDETRRVGTVRLDGLRVSAAHLLGAPGTAWPAISRALDRGAAAVAAEMIGAAEGALDLTVRFARDRVQFGSPIGRYQGVKHPLADAYVDVESMKSLVYYAAWALDSAPEEVPRAVSEAKAFASIALSRIGVTCVQLHGAVGYTLEYDVQLYLKRSKWARPAYGDEDHHHDRLAELGGY